MFGALLAASMVIPCTIGPIPTPLLRAELMERYGERRHDTTHINDDVDFEIWGNNVKGSWTILAVFSNGRACVLTTGTGFRPGELG